MTSKLASQFSALAQATARGNRALVFAALLGASSLMAAPVAQAQTKIGYVNVERILYGSNTAKSAQAKIESEFRKRNDELERLANNLRAEIQKYDKDAPALSDSERIRRQRKLEELEADLQRKERQFQEDVNLRRNELFSDIIDKADNAIQRIAESQGYDLIITDAVTVSPKVDITDEVLKAIGG